MQERQEGVLTIALPNHPRRTLRPSHLVHTFILQVNNPRHYETGTEYK